MIDSDGRAFHKDSESGPNSKIMKNTNMTFFPRHYCIVLSFKRQGLKERLSFLPGPWCDDEDFGIAAQPSIAQVRHRPRDELVWEAGDASGCSHPRGGQSSRGQRAGSVHTGKHCR